MDEIWILFALISAFSLATADALTKNTVTKENEYIVGWLRLALSLPLLLPAMFIEGIPRPDKTFYIAAGTALPLEIGAYYLYIKALRVSPLGLTIPFLSFTPIFIIGVSYLILGEDISFRGALGIFLVALGGYGLNFTGLKGDVLLPFRNIAKEPGSIMMLFVSAIYAVTASLGKVCITHSSPIFFGAAYYVVLSVLFLPFALPQLKRHGIKGTNMKISLAAGVFTSCMVISHMLAMNIGKAAYMVSVKRTSMIISVLYGFFLFGEKHLVQRLLGVAMMMCGIILIAGAR